jgi:hypothetical protein
VVAEHEEDEMDLKKLGQQARSLVDKRGGTDSLKQDADELKDIAKGKGSVADKAKAAVEAIKDPGADDAAAEAPVAAEASEQDRGRAAEKVEGEERGKHAGEKGHGRHGGHGRHRNRGGGGGADPAV